MQTHPISANVLIPLAVAGAAGKMGTEVIQTIASSERHILSQALVSPQSRFRNQPINQFAYHDCYQQKVFETKIDADNLPRALIVFSAAEATLGHVRQAANHGIATLICSTGFSTEQREQLAHTCRNIAWCLASNTSIGIMWLSRLVKKLAEALPEADVEILDSHHNNKLDAPSGTAIRLGEAVAQGRNISLEKCAVHGRAGMKKRHKDEIGFASLRLGSIVGEHSVYFGLPGETICLSHQVLNRQTFAQGAVTLASNLADKPPKKYTVEDIL